MSPDSQGNFKGISVPRIPWEEQTHAKRDRERRADPVRNLERHNRIVLEYLRDEDEPTSGPGFPD